jgi:hypothetical protein
MTDSLVHMLASVALPIAVREVLLDMSNALSKICFFGVLPFEWFALWLTLV